MSSAFSTNMPFLYHTRTISRLSRREISRPWQAWDFSYTSNKACVNPAAHCSNILVTRRGLSSLPVPRTPRARDYRHFQTNSWVGTDYRQHESSGSSTVPQQDDDRIDDTDVLGMSHGRHTQVPPSLGMEDFDMSLMDDGAEWDEAEDNINGIRNGDSTPSYGNDREEMREKHGMRSSTITPMERYAFQRIFSDIFERRQKSKNMSPYEGSFESELDGLENRPRNRRAAVAKLGGIMSNAVGKGAHQANDNVEAILQQYPEVLRETAARAMGVLEDAKDTEHQQAARPSVPIYTEEHLERLQRLEEAREPERARVEKLMDAAKTDIELWEVMEAEVFSLIPRLGLQDIKKETESRGGEIKKNKKTVTKSKKKGKTVEIDELVRSEGLAQSENSAAGNLASQLALYGPLYPSYLLLGLRLLDRAFVRPSPLTISLLHKIKSLGYTSHVLGASTQFYNELLRIYRYRLDDLSGMISLLEEMERSALEMDAETYEIVADVMRTQAKVRDGQRGTGMRALWKLPRYAPKNFGAWKDQIAYTIENHEEEGEKQYSETVKSWEAA